MTFPPFARARAGMTFEVPVRIARVGEVRSIGDLRK